MRVMSYLPHYHLGLRSCIHLAAEPYRDLCSTRVGLHRWYLSAIQDGMARARSGH